MGANSFPATAGRMSYRLMAVSFVLGYLAFLRQGYLRRPNRSENVNPEAILTMRFDASFRSLMELMINWLGSPMASDYLITMYLFDFTLRWGFVFFFHEEFVAEGKKGNQWVAEETRLWYKNGSYVFICWYWWRVMNHTKWNTYCRSTSCRNVFCWLWVTDICIYTFVFF